MTNLRRSRPARQAAQAAGTTEAEILRRFADSSVLIALDEPLRDDVDARATFLFAVNQCLRFAGAVAVRATDHALVAAASDLAGEITGASLAELDSPDATLLVGTRVERGVPAVTVCSEGWLARLATSASDIDELPRAATTPNALGALAAACLGVSQVFHFFSGLPLASAVELSLYELIEGPLGSLEPGPALPQGLDIDALLVGCGGVMHGFVYALRDLGVGGRARAVDRQRQRDENVGPYVLATLERVGQKKAEIVREVLAKTISVTPYDEDFYPLFTTRLDRGHLPLPPVVFAGLDRVAPRHHVQRLWPELLIDLGAGGETAQVIVKRRTGAGACVLELLDRPPTEVDELERLAAESGLAGELIRDAMDEPLTEADVRAAPVKLRPDMEAARRRGELRCGFVRSRALDHEQGGDEFLAAAPFVVAFAGIVGAAEFVKAQVGLATSRELRYQFSFASLHGACSSPVADEHCECQNASRA